jgi:hypothetical protein
MAPIGFRSQQRGNLEQILRSEQRFFTPGWAKGALLIAAPATACGASQGDFCAIAKKDWFFRIL